MSTIRVSKILVHPIKSCRGISVDQARVTLEGLEYDRQWCIINAGDGSVITAREVSKMVLITPHIDQDAQVLSVSLGGPGSPVFSVPLKPTQDVLGTWTRVADVMMFGAFPFDGYICEALPADNMNVQTVSEMLSTYFERPVHLVYKGTQPRICEPTFTHPALDARTVFQDLFPLMVLSEESTTRIEEELRTHVGKQGVDECWKTERLATERFRPNIVFQGAGAFAEDSWKEIEIGSGPKISLVSKCTRCLLPNVSPETGVRDPAVPYKTLMKFRTGLDPVLKMKPCVGVNGVPLRLGELKVGDIVEPR